VHDGTNQKAAHAHHGVQLRPPLLRIPADPVIPIGQLQGRGGEPHAAQPAVLGADQIAQLPSHQRAGSLGMLADHQLVPYPQLLVGAHPQQLQSPDGAHLLRHGLGRRHRCGQPPRGARPDPLPRRHRQDEMSRRFQLAQRLDTAAALRPATRVMEAELLTHRCRQGAAVRPTTRRQQRTNRGDAIRLGQGPLDLMLSVHAPRIRGPDTLVQYLPAGKRQG